MDSTQVEINNQTPQTHEKQSKGLWFEALKQLFKNKAAMVGLGIIGLLILTAILAPLLAPYDPLETKILYRLKAPSAQHLLGTDDLGRDIFSRIIYGSRISLQVGLISVGIALVFGVSAGVIAGYYGGKIDMLIMRLMDIMLAFPSILLAIAIMAILGPQLSNAMLAIGIVNLPRFARIVRSSVLTVKEEEYIEAAKSLGASDLRIMLGHLLPNCLAPLIVQSTLSIAGAILEAASLSFLGLGAQPPIPEWGAMLSAGRASLQIAPWVVAFPGLAIAITVLGFNLFGDGLRDALDPK